MDVQPAIPSVEGYYSASSRRHAGQTRERARRKRIEKERQEIAEERRRLTRLGADPAWIDRVLPRE